MRRTQMTRETVIVLAALLLVSGCATERTKQIDRQIDADQAQGVLKIAAPAITPSRKARVKVVSGAYLPLSVVTPSAPGAWLKDKRVAIDLERPVPLDSVIRMLASQGVNISSPFPLDGYTFAGKLSNTDAQTALRAVLSSVGLDYTTDDDRQLVTLRTMTTRTWYLSIGNRRSNFQTDSGASSGSSGQLGASSSSGGGGSASGGAMSGGGSGGGSQSGGSTGGGQAASSGASAGATQTSGSQSSSVSSAGGTGTAAGDDFWTSLAKELDARVQVLVPASRGSQTIGSGIAGQMPGGSPQLNPPLPPGLQIPSIGMPQGQLAGIGSSGGNNGGDLFTSRRVGSYALNPDTGSVTIQAPGYLLEELDVYMRRVESMYNTRISFSAELLLVTSTRSDGEGLDLRAFADWSNKYGLYVSNNSLGGVTVTMPTVPGRLPSVTAPVQAVGGPLIGITAKGAVSAMQAFNAYLTEIGRVTVLQRPLITTTNGVPGTFSKKTQDYYNTVSQQAASGGTGAAAVGTQNTLVQFETGVDLRVNPRIDLSTGLIRAQLTLNHVAQSGVRPIAQTITFGSNASTVTTNVPIRTSQSIAGEILLRDGDLIIVGGQTEDGATNDASGLPGSDGPMAGLLGTRKVGTTKSTTYFAMRVEVVKGK